MVSRSPSGDNGSDLGEWLYWHAGRGGTAGSSARSTRVRAGDVALLRQYTFLDAIGPAVADARIGAIAGFPYTAPCEEIRLRRPA